MERFTVSLDEELLADFDAYCGRKGYQNRSEAVRDILRDRLEADRLEADSLERQATSHCVGCLSYIYNHHERELSRRLTEAQHQHHDLMLSTMHVHLDHENCLEVAILRGPIGAVHKCADSIVAETGVRHGKLNVVPVETDLTAGHHHHDEAPGHTHVHSRPKT